MTNNVCSPEDVDSESEFEPLWDDEDYIMKYCHQCDESYSVSSDTEQCDECGTIFA